LAHLKDVLDTTGRSREELDFFAEAKFTRRIGALAFGNADIENSVFRRRGLGVFYQDECLRFELVYEQERTQNRTLGGSNELKVRLILATLGDTAERGPEER
jgi:LPS-assembly protein